MIIKVCGMREPDNIRAVEQLGTDWMGFILYNRSPRFVSRTPEYLPVSCRRVGVFVNATPAYLYNKVKELRLDIVQLHGHESPSLCAELRQYGLTVVKAFPVESEKDLELTVPYEHCCDYFLFDKRVSTFGGSGQSFPWNVLDAYQASVPFSAQRRSVARQPCSPAHVSPSAMGRHRPQQLLRNRSRCKRY